MLNRLLEFAQPQRTNGRLLVFRIANSAFDPFNTQFCHFFLPSSFIYDVQAPHHGDLHAHCALRLHHGDLLHARQAQRPYAQWWPCSHPLPPPAHTPLHPPPPPPCPPHRPPTPP